MLPLLFPDENVRAKLLENAETAPIPPLQREMFRFARRFVRSSWEMGPSDLQRLRDAGLSEADIVLWAMLGSTQSWFVMNADGGGIPLDRDALTGPGVGRMREEYEAMPDGLLAEVGQSGDPAARVDSTAWVATDENADGLRETVSWAEARYGFVPNLLRAVSLQPAYYPRHQLALELLERPQADSLSPRQHALVRARVTQLLQCAYSERTTRPLLERATGDPELWEHIGEESYGSEPADRAVLELTAKLVRNAYKVTEKDAASFRDLGLDDEAYVDVVNTVAIQISLDRLANALGVAPDQRPVRPR